MCWDEDLLQLLFFLVSIAVSVANLPLLDQLVIILDATVWFVGVDFGVA